MKRYRFVIGAVVIAGCLAYLLVTSVQQSAAAHMTLSDLLEKAAAGRADGERIQLGGSRVVLGSIQWDQYRHRPAFTISDGGRELRVQYRGNAVLPDTFKDGAQVVLEGRYNASETVFEADVVFAKCPSKYEGQSYGEHVEAYEDGP